MSTTLLIIGAGLGILLVLGAGIALLSGGGNQINVDERLDQFAGSEDWEPEFLESVPTEESVDVADRIDSAISDRGFSFFDTVKTRISRADLKLRVSEYIGIVVAAIVFGGGIGFYLMGSEVGAILGAVLGSQAPRIYANMTATKRLRAFDDQLSDTLNLWVNALRSGFSVLQAIEAIARELPPPISKEFDRLLQEVRLGIDMEEALDNVLRRMPSEDFDLVVTAVKVQREVGGNLAEILDVISHTIRERVRIKGEIRTLTAQGRASGWVITVLPIGLGLVLTQINPDYIGEILNNQPPYIIPNLLPCGWLMIGIALLMIGLGGFAIMKIVDIEV